MKVIILTLLFAVAYVVNGKAITGEYSTDVPQTCVNLSFACSDLHIARKCKAVPACIEVWESLKAPIEDNNEICDLCKEMVKEARDQLLSNQTEEEMKEVFEGSCNLIPVKAVAAECRKVVDELIPDIIDTLASRMDPNMVCTVAGLCNNGILKSLIRKQYKISKPLEIPRSVIDPEKCKSCTRGMSFVKKALNIIPENDLTVLLLHSCIDEFHGTQAQCEVFLKSLLPIAYNYLKVVSPEVVCGEMTMCPAIEKPIVAAGDELTCEFCEALVTYLKTFIDSNSTEAEFRTAFQNMCKDLKEFSTQCTDLVDEYFDQFYDFLKQNLNPQTACSAIGLCSSSQSHVPLVRLVPATKIESLAHVPILLSKAEQRQQMLKLNRAIPINSEPQVRLVPAEGRESLDESIHVGVKVQPSYDTKHAYNEMRNEEVEKESNRIDFEGQPIERLGFGLPSHLQHSEVECSVCKGAVVYLEQILGENRTEESIREALDRVCAIFPTELSDQCQDFVNEYTELFVSLLLSHADPNTICAALKACPTAEDSRLPQELPAKLETANKATFTPQCMLCEKVVEYLEKYLENNRTEEAIKNALDRVCEELPARYATQCEQFVDEYADMVIELLTHEVAPAMLCAALGLCPGDNYSGGNLDCTVCQYVLHYLQEQLMDNSTEEEIKQEIELVCSKLPKTLADNCNAFIEEFGSSLLVLIAQRLDPSVVCVDLKVCTSDVKPVEPKVVISSLKLDTCSTCEMVVNYMDKLLETDAVDVQITTLVEKVCQLLPLAARDDCNQIIGLYGPYLLQMIGQLADSTAVCQAVDLCSKAAQRNLLGGEKCTFGPSYWCQSVEHASACNAHVYCKQKIWK